MYVMMRMGESIYVDVRIFKIIKKRKNIKGETLCLKQNKRLVL